MIQNFLGLALLGIGIGAQYTLQKILFSGNCEATGMTSEDRTDCHSRKFKFYIHYFMGSFVVLFCIAQMFIGWIRPVNSAARFLLVAIHSLGGYGIEIVACK